MKALFALLLIFSAASLFGDTANVRPSWSGAWYNPDQPGHGISVEILDDERTVFFWFTYDLDGEPIWLIAEGVNSEISLTGMFIPHIRVEATAYYYEGMIFGEFEPATNTKQEWGTIFVDFPNWQCDQAHMEWHPVMEGFSHGSTDLVRLTSIYGMDCVEPQDIPGNWEVQFGLDSELKYPVEIVRTPNQEDPGMSDLVFEFFDETDCLWSGEIFTGFGLIGAEWSNQCGATVVEHDGAGKRYYEYRLCDASKECTWKDEVMVFDDEGDLLIFSR